MKKTYFHRNATAVEWNAKSQIFNNIQRLEDEIGDAIEYESFLQGFIFSHKFIFHTDLSDVVRKRQQKWDKFWNEVFTALRLQLLMHIFLRRDLHEFIKSKLELLM